MYYPFLRTARSPTAWLLVAGVACEGVRPKAAEREIKTPSTPCCKTRGPERCSLYSDCTVPGWTLRLRNPAGTGNFSEIYALVRYYAALSGTSVQTFRNNPAVPYSRVEKCKKSRLNRGRRLTSRRVVFLFRKESRLVLGSTQPLIQRLQRGLFLSIRLPEREADHSNLVLELRMSGAFDTKIFQYRFFSHVVSGAPCVPFGNTTRSVCR
jgi:hypothetical protein